MKRKRLIGTLLLITIALMWCAGMALLVYGLQGAPQRTRELASISLDRILGNQRYQMENMIHRIEEELLAEAARIGRSDSLVANRTLEEWLQVSGSDPSISSVNLAWENGDGWTLEMHDTSWAFIQVEQGSRVSPPIVTEGGRSRTALSQVRTRLADHPVDPRATAWFGQSLGMRPNATVWSTDTVANAMRLNVSTILRSDPTSPYRILCFNIVPHRAIERSGMRPTTHFAVYMTAEGSNLMPLDTAANGPAVRDARQAWSTTRSKDVAMREVNGDVWASQIVPFRLNGTTLYCGAVIDTQRFQRWTSFELNAFRIGIAIMGGLGVLLVWAWLRLRRTNQRVRRQEKRSRSRERQLAKAIGEREVLDREVHHRVKTNLQVVSSLLNLQAQRIVDEGPRAEFMRSKRRIDSMALVHHKLYGQQDLRAIDLKQFFTQIANAMQAMFEPKSRVVSHSVETGGITADADTAIQLGVILCELLANCHEHAFPYATGGHIEVLVRAAGAEQFALVVSDNGQGIVRDPSHSSAELGLEIAEALAEQIDGRLEVVNDKGTRVTVLFRMQGLRGVPGLGEVR